MAALSNAQMEKRLSCYLPRAVAYATEECITRREQRKFLKDLVANIYVMYHSEQCGWSDAYDENWPNLVISSLPNRLLYSDWYGRTIEGAFDCGTFLLMKSTAEPFARKEAALVKEYIFDDINEEKDPDLWSFEVEQLGRGRLWIKVYRMEPGPYIDGMMDEMRRLTREQANRFVAVHRVPILEASSLKRNGA